MVYKRLLRDSFASLAPALQRLHGTDGGVRCAGPVTVMHERGWLAWLARFPKAGENVRLELEVSPAGEGETWTRHFGGVLLRSVQRCRDGQLVEQMGPVRMYFRVFADGPDLRMESVKARYLGLPLPVQVTAVERGCGSDKLEFEVHVMMVGSYRGVLELQP
jgi:hypothetical protein